MTAPRVSPAAPRVSNVAREAMPRDRVALFDHVMAVRKLSSMPNMFAMMAHSPGALEAVAAVGEHVRFNSALDPALCELVICTVSREVGNRYEWCHHIHRVPAALRDKVGTRAIEDEPAPVGPALRFARLVANREAVDAALIETLRAALGERGLIDLTVMAGYYLLLGGFCNTLNVALEPAIENVPFPA